MKLSLSNPRDLALIAIMTALVMALTMLVQIPTPIGGFVHLGDVAIYFVALAFGPIVGLIAGGLGTAFADLALGYAAFAPLTLVVHGLQGYVAGWIFKKNPSPLFGVIAVVVGGVILVGGYFLGEIAMWGVAAAASEIPANTIQASAGALGLVVYLAVAQAYPRLRQAQDEAA